MTAREDRSTAATVKSAAMLRLPANRRFRSVRAVAVLATVATACLGLAAPGGAAAASRNRAQQTHNATVATHFAVTKRVCNPAPKPGFAACDAIRLVRTTKATPGARRYAVNASLPLGPAGGYTPGDLGTGYGFDPGATPARPQTIGIVDAYDDPAIAADLDEFDVQYHLPAETPTSFVKISQTGSTTVLPRADTTGWSDEEALDVETARGICNQCTIVLVEANSPADSNLAAGVKEAVSQGATEVSNSYGGPENAHWSAAKRVTYRSLYTYRHVVVTAATGDDGWFSWDFANDNEPGSQAPNLPASLPTVVAVGGTTLALGPHGMRRTERVWNSDGRSDATAIQQNEGDLGASGGGCSVLYRAPGWQEHVKGYVKTGCGVRRLAADVSADGDPETGLDIVSNYDCGGPCEPTGWQTVGGTSLSAPLIAAMWALAGGSGGIPYPDLSLYGHLKSAPASLFDVHFGGNSWCDQDAKCAKHTKTETGEANPNDLCIIKHKKCVTPLRALDCGFVRKGAKPTAVARDAQCNAEPGYDGPSGVGTPIGLSAFTPLFPRPRVAVPASVVAGRAATFTAGGSDPFPGGVFTSYQWSWGDGTQSTTKTTTGRHSYAVSGDYTMTLTVTDTYGQVGATAKTVDVAVAG
ncbi:MAG TPA: PKD domain-containing protein [Mycobacteriales bacterium]|nr:PKD domain-containing protein [Mycobacteriales bacterium]